MNASRVLDRLERVRQSGPGRWLARCPAHEDRSPSLSIRELDDGRVLVHCFGGCGTNAVLAALGLTMADLFEKPLGEFRPSHSRVPARELLEVIAFETAIVVDVAGQLVNKQTVSAEDWARLRLAARRILAARDHSHV